MEGLYGSITIINNRDKVEVTVCLSRPGTLDVGIERLYAQPRLRRTSIHRRSNGEITLHIK